MNASDLKRYVTERGSPFFNRESMKMMGDSMSNFGVRSVIIDSVSCWELYRRRPTSKGMTQSHYFRKDNYTKMRRPRHEGNHNTEH